MRGRDALSRFYKKTKEPVNKSIHNFRIWTIALLAVLLLTGCHDYEADLQVEQPNNIHQYYTNGDSTDDESASIIRVINHLYFSML